MAAGFFAALVVALAVLHGLRSAAQVRELFVFLAANGAALGVFGIAIATVILPSLSAHTAAARGEQFSLTLDWAVRMVLLIAVPAALALLVLAGPILVTLFQYRAFGMDDVAMSALSLSAYAAGLPAFIAVKVLAPGFYARQDTKTPVKIAIIAMASNMVLNLAFVASLLAIGFRGPHTGLALASSLAAYINAGLLYRMLRRQGAYQPERGWRRLYADSVVQAHLGADLDFLTDTVRDTR